MNPVEVKNLRKSYGKFQALKEISFNIKKGEIFGLLGPNGAGKSTTITILAGLLYQDSGKVTILGKDMPKQRREAAMRMNVVTAFTNFNGIISLYENLRVYGMLYNVKNLEKRINYLLRLFEIDHLRNKRAYTLSSGEMIRASICKGLLNKPSVLLLDECTVGLDPDVAEKTRRIIKDLQKKEGTTILFTSHNMAEVEELCDRIAFLYQGKILKVGTATSLKKMIKKQTVQIDFMKPARSLKNFFKRLDVEVLFVSQDRVIFQMEHADYKINDIITPLIKQGFRIKDILVRKPSLEDVFIKIARSEI